MSQQVILVDEIDRPIGEGEKLSVHQTGELHRAFSVFLFDAGGRWLLQRRHPTKYHSGGLWTNTCCSHPAPGQETGDAARERLYVEMGIQTPLEPLFRFHYRAEFENALIEHELDHVFIGQFDGAPVPNDAEVCDWRWLDTPSLLKELADYPYEFTYWFRIAVPRVLGARRHPDTRRDVAVDGPEDSG